MPRKASITRTAKVAITTEMFKIFKNKFKINGRFRVNEKFVNFFKFEVIQKRFLNINNCCSYYFDNNFNVKINKNRKFKYFDENMNENVLYSELSLTIRFICFEEVV